MAARRLSMRKIREVLRLKWENGCSVREAWGQPLTGDISAAKFLSRLIDGRVPRRGHWGLNTNRIDQEQSVQCQGLTPPFFEKRGGDRNKVEI